MNSILRHYSVRLWLTAFIGVAAGILLLPGWQRVWGVHWLIIPVSLIMALVFIGLGWAMNRIGTRFLTQQFKEAAVWERAGLIPETWAAFEQAAALFDSFWLSPRKRRTVNQWVSSRVARFHLSRPVLKPDARVLVTAHLNHHPDDEAVAERWLSHLLGLTSHFPEEYETAARVGDFFQDHSRIQWLLFQFYLQDRRTDFEALKTYQNVWQHQSSLPQEVLVDLAGLLLEDTQLNDWCLQIYLQAYEAGELACLEGIGAAVRWLPEHADNATSLANAKKLISGLPSERLQTLTKRFEDHAVQPAAPKQPGVAAGGAAFIAALGRALTVMVHSGHRSAAALSSLARSLAAGERPPIKFRNVYLPAAFCLVVVAAGVLIWRSWHANIETAGPLNTPPPVKELAPITTDPFTIQVAAYLNPDDAKSYVQQLKQKGLDAFSTQAISADRKWFQVKVSHFPTKAQAQEYGDQLKSKGFIDDFYVANYQQQTK